MCRKFPKSIRDLEPISYRGVLPQKKKKQRTSECVTGSLLYAEFSEKKEEFHSAPTIGIYIATSIVNLIIHFHNSIICSRAVFYKLLLSVKLFRFRNCRWDSNSAVLEFLQHVLVRYTKLSIVLGLQSV
jgi:hypothetical protein